MVAYVNDVLDLAQHSSDGLADEGNGLEQTSLADQNVEESLVNADELES